MQIKKAFNYLLLIPLILLETCNNSKKENIIPGEIKPKAETVINSVPPLLISPRANSYREEVEKYLIKITKDKEYFLENIEGREELSNRKYLEDYISQHIKNVGHTYVENPENRNKFYNLSELNLNQLQKVYLMCESLKDTSFIESIGKIIEEDIQDPFAEHGGVIVFNKGKIKLNSLESGLKKDTLNNEFYSPSDDFFKKQSILYFHLHATSYNESKFAHPSILDLITAYYHIDLFNESNEIVITSLKRGKFNLDYYGGYKEEGVKIKALDLGNYNYENKSN